ncbi:MAG: hypothetical protein ACLRPT_06120 [Akkermansia muciniphila]
MPEEIRPLIGTRLYGCDTCVTVCPWNGKPLPDVDERFRMSRLLASIPLRGLFPWMPAVLRPCSGIPR